MDEDRRSIAVLPFVNMSGDPENEYFSDGISEEILNLLTKLPKLRVSSRTSSFAFKGKDIEMPAVAQRLGVGTILEGSVRRAGDRVRITAQLIDTKSDSHLWSESYDRRLEDVFAIQDDIARCIVNALRVTLTPQERLAIQYTATSNPQAYDFYLRGRSYYNAMTKRGFTHALTLYQEAIERDPNYALAFAGIADVYSFLFKYGGATPEIAGRALDASQRAVELDGGLAEAHTSRGLALSINGRHEEAEARVRACDRVEAIALRGLLLLWSRLRVAGQERQGRTPLRAGGRDQPGLLRGVSIPGDRIPQDRPTAGGNGCGSARRCRRREAPRDVSG